MSELIVDGTLVIPQAEVAILEDSAKNHLAEQVSAGLALHYDTMLQYDPKDILGIISEGRAVIGIDPHGKQLKSFAQISPWISEAGSVGAVEFRSWLSLSSGAGIPVLLGAVALSRIRYPEVDLYAVVEANNTHAQKKIRQAGGIETPMPKAIQIELKAGEKPAPVIAFSLGEILA